MKILTTGNGVIGSALDRDIGEFILTHPHMTIPVQTLEFAINVPNMPFWEAPVQRWVEACLAGTEGPRGEVFKMRWIASMVAEVHRIPARGATSCARSTTG